MSSNSSGFVTGSSFDSQSIENLLIRTDSLDKIKSILPNHHAHGGKVSKLSRNLTDHKINALNLNKSEFDLVI